jgi:hypothetical protein
MMFNQKKLARKAKKVMNAARKQDTLLVEKLHL